ncbi:MAG: nucleotidyltransferase domain-containing protein [ANME-2 cluster archaeon]|nr:nucleotidyltransferase domain-containing protein [ANME-2 cluster archaeon]
MTAKQSTNVGTKEPINDILQELKGGLQEKYGSKLKGVMLFGSYARGKQKMDSDIDIAIILEDFAYACSEIERTGDLVSALSLKFDNLISLVPIKENDWLKTRISEFIYYICKKHHNLYFSFI